MTDQRLLDMLRGCLGALESGQRFKGLLKDYFPQEPVTVNVLVLLYEMGIHTEMAKADSVTKDLAHRFAKRLVDGYGIDRDRAESAVALFCSCYAEILGKPCDLGRGGGAAAGNSVPASVQPAVADQPTVTSIASSPLPLFWSAASAAIRQQTLAPDHLAQVLAPAAPATLYPDGFGGWSTVQVSTPSVPAAIHQQTVVPSNSAQKPVPAQVQPPRPQPKAKPATRSEVVLGCIALALIAWGVFWVIWSFAPGIWRYFIGSVSGLLVLGGFAEIVRSGLEEAKPDAEWWNMILGCLALAFVALVAFCAIWSFLSGGWRYVVASVLGLLGIFGLARSGGR